MKQIFPIIIFCVALIAACSVGFLPEAVWALIAAGLLCGLLLYQIHIRKNQNFILTWPDILILCLWLWAALSVFWSVVPFATLTSLLPMSLLPLAYFYTRFADENLVKRLPYIIAYLGGLLAVGAILQVVIGSGTFIKQATWPFANPNALALMLVIGFVMVLSLIKPDQKSYKTTILLVLVGIGVMLTGSRVGLVSLFAALIPLLIFHKHFIRPTLGAVSVMGLFSAYLYFIGSDITLNTSARILSGFVYDDYILGMRPLIWQETLRLIQDAPLIGLGLGSFMWRYISVQPALENSAGLTAHNEFLQITLELGVIGLFLFLAIIFLSVHGTFRTRKTHIVLAALCLIGISACVDFPLHSMPILIVCGALLAGLAKEKRPLRIIQVPSQFLAFLALIIVGVSTMAVVANILTARATKLSEVNLTKAHNYLQAASYFDLGLDADRPRTLAMMLLYAMDPLTTTKAQRDQAEKQIERLFDRSRALNPYDAKTELYEATVNMALFKSFEAQLIEALKKSPRMLAARFLLADYYRRNDKQDAAIKLVEDGMMYSYAFIETALWFPRIVDLSQKLGRTDLAEKARVRLTQIPLKP